MIIPRDRLMALLGGPAPLDDDELPRERRVPYPSPSDVLYATPNPDGTRKRCGNCWKWLTAGGCIEVAGEIDQGQVCGLHVFGKPQPAVLLTDPPPKIPGTAAGLVLTPDGDGTSCDLCRFYSPSQGGVGLCEAVGSSDGLPPVVVDPRGCCARWQPMAGLGAPATRRGM